MIKANNPNLRSWVSVPDDSDFPIQNIPFGIFSTSIKSKRVGIAIGDQVLDLFEIASAGLLNSVENDPSIFNNHYLNSIINKGKAYSRALRNIISEILEETNPVLRDNLDLRTNALIPVNDVTMHLQVKVGDYTDFYSSKDHATNVGKMFRDPENALLPNWLYIPVGYHGRASSIIASGQAIKRPKGQVRPNAEEPPVLSACKLLDFELEMAFITHPGKPLGDCISTDEAEDYIFGTVSSEYFS